VEWVKTYAEVWKGVFASPFSWQSFFFLLGQVASLFVGWMLGAVLLAFARLRRLSPWEAWVVSVLGFVLKTISKGASKDGQRIVSRAKQ
jgi:hypothetical protein